MISNYAQLALEWFGWSVMAYEWATWVILESPGQSGRYA